jgi:hypothetical protein
MKWRDSWTYGIRELVIEADTRAQEMVVGRVEMNRGTITGFCGLDYIARNFYYDKYDFPRPDRYRAVEKAVEEAVLIKHSKLAQVDEVDK